MLDAVDIQDVLFEIESEQHPIITTTRGAQSEEFVCEGLAEPARVMSEGPGDEFDDRGGGFFGELAEPLQRRTGDFDLPSSRITRPIL